MIELKFENCKWGKLIDFFGLERVDSLPLLTEWTQFQTVFNEYEIQILKQIQYDAIIRGNDMNEDEVKFRLIAPLTLLGNFPTRPYTVYTQRDLSAQIGDYELAGRVDFLLASGNQEPKEPFFFLQEYKPAQLRNSDPLGQVLAAMLTAQTNNGKAHNHPILGAVVIASTWNFIVLDGKQFTVSPDFSATTEAVYRVPAILRGVNDYAKQWLGLPPE